VAGGGDGDAGGPYRGAGEQVEREVAATVVAEVNAQRHAERATHGRADEGPGETAKFVVFRPAVASGGGSRQPSGEEAGRTSDDPANDRSSGRSLLVVLRRDDPALAQEQQGGRAHADGPHAPFSRGHARG